jgi:hypothetical protein
MPFKDAAMCVVTKLIFHQEEFYFNFDWPQILYEYSCKAKDFMDMLPRVEWKFNRMKTHGFRRCVCHQYCPIIFNNKVCKSYLSLYHWKVISFHYCLSYFVVQILQLCKLVVFLSRHMFQKAMVSPMRHIHIGTAECIKSIMFIPLWICKYRESLEYSITFWSWTMNPRYVSAILSNKRLIDHDLINLNHRKGFYRMQISEIR